MAGQQAQSFTSSPGPRSDIGSMARGPSVGTQQYQPTPARFSNNGQGLAALGDALGGFFGGVAKVEATLDEINHREDLVQIQRENEALSKQALVDQKTGKPMDPALKDRRAYAEVFVTSAADQTAFDLGEELETEMKKLPFDGDDDPSAFAREFFKKQVGNGSGDPDYDARLLSRFTQRADALAAQFNDTRREVAFKKSAKTVSDAVVLQTRRGLAPASLAELRDRVRAVTRGDEPAANKILLGAIAEGIQNDKHAVAALESARALGLEESEPVLFNDLTAAALKRTTSVKSWDAGLAVDQFQVAVAEAKAHSPKGRLTPEKFMELWRQARDIDGVHGVGMGAFGILQEMPNVFQEQAEHNAVTLALTGIQGTHNLGAIARGLGHDWKTVMKKQGSGAISEWAVSRSAAIAQTVDGTGLMRPMESDAAMQDLAKLVTAGGANGRYRQATMDTLPDEIAHEVGMSILGRDPERGTRGYTFLRALKDSGMTPDQMKGYFPNSAAEERFYTLEAYQSGTLPVGKLIQFLADNPHDAAAFTKAAGSGTARLFSMAQSMGYTGSAPDLDKKLSGFLSDAVLSATGRDTWGNAIKDKVPYVKATAISLDSNERAKFEARVLQQLVTQRTIGMPMDLDLAAKTAAKQSHGYILVPGFDGSFQAVADPFKGLGRSLDHPINMDPRHPLSTSKGYQPIYSPGVQIMNAEGKVEDTAETWDEDAKAAHKVFPGMIPDYAKLYLERPSLLGLSAVRNVTGMPIQFVPGQAVALRVGATSVTSDKAGYEKVTVPKDPKEAGEFFKKHLPPGWYVQQDGADTPDGRAFTLYYGARLKMTRKDLDARIEERGTFHKQMKINPPKPDAVTVLPGATASPDDGAAIVYPTLRGWVDRKTNESP